MSAPGRFLSGAILHATRRSLGGFGNHGGDNLMPLHGGDNLMPLHGGDNLMPLRGDF